ncbi:MAG: prepilin-type N-terminal cleavage/methylation domain-containing protein [Planctomycetes bacterium]|nr:prepilin-type N-terminal cleavage/methylation domain-containing protein [Planctomycetota bacterium]
MKRRGFTLTELLVTIAIIAVIMGLSTAALRSAGNKDELVATQQAVRALLRRSRNAAREERYQVTLEIDPVTSELTAQQKTTVTQFHLEAPTPFDTTPGFAFAGEPVPLSETVCLRHEGARAYELWSEDAEPTKGKIADALLFEKTDVKGAAWAWVEHTPALMPREGVHIRCWIYLGDLSTRLVRRRSQERRNAGDANYERAGPAYREAPARLRDFDPMDPPYFVIARKGRAFGFSVTAAYELEVAVTGQALAGEVTYVTRTRPHTLRPDRWYRVEFGFDGRSVRIVVDGIGRMHLPVPGNEELPGSLIRDPSPLAFSDPDPRRGFFGMIDEIKVGGIVSTTRISIPKDISLIAPGRTVSFDLLGQLDPSRHAEPFVLYLCNAADFEEKMDPRPAAGTPAAKAALRKGATRTRDQQDKSAKAAQDKGKIVIGPKRFARFLKIRADLQERQYRRIVVDRTGLVSE